MKIWRVEEMITGTLILETVDTKFLSSLSFRSFQITNEPLDKCLNFIFILQILSDLLMTSHQWSFSSIFFRLPLIYCRTSRARATPSSTASCPRSSARVCAQPAASTAAAAHASETGSGNHNSLGCRTMIWTVRVWLPMATTRWRAQSWTARKTPLWRHSKLVAMVS